MKRPVQMTIRAVVAFLRLAFDWRRGAALERLIGQRWYMLLSATAGFCGASLALALACSAFDGRAWKDAALLLFVGLGVLATASFQLRSGLRGQEVRVERSSRSVI